MDLDDNELLQHFEALDLPPHALHHREKVRLAYAMLRDADFGEAAVRFRRGLKRFAEAAGAPTKYHETLTWAYLAVVNQRMSEGATASSQELIARHPDLLDPVAALAPYYDVAATLASPLARRVFVLPGRP